MHKRTGIIAALALIVALAALLMPVARMMDEMRNAALDEKQRGVMDALLVHQAHMNEAPGENVLAMIDIEDAWDIEDTREESEYPLVTSMHNGESALGFDVESRTFYCTIGLDGEDWPELSLTAKGAEGVRVAWIDDYTYDWRTDAVAEGYGYELIAYTDTAYEYIYIVFTGLPIVTLHAHDEIDAAYGPACVTVSGAGYEAVNSAALVHTRSGGFYPGIDKFSYRVEFHQLGQNGKAETAQRSVLGIAADSDWLLLSNAQDTTAVRNELCWDLWRKWNEGKDNYAVLDTRMVEVFVGDEYKGLYQLCQRIDVEKELLRMGGNPNTDAVVRLIRPARDTGRPVEDHMADYGVAYELRNVPRGMSSSGGFALMTPYEQMNYHEGDLTDEEFTALAESWLDVGHLMDYYLFFQACSLGGDNVYNNLYLWIQKENGQYRCRFSPWDMDRSFNTDVESGEPDELDLQMAMPRRLLAIDALDSRKLLHENFEQKRAAFLSDDALYQWIEALETKINASGAYLRESEKWRGGAEYLDLKAISAGAIMHMSTIEYYLKELWPRNDL